MRIDLGNVQLMALLFLQVLEDPLFSVPIEDTLNYNCWLTTILPDAGEVDLAVLAELKFSLDQLLLNISCVDCTSPDFGDLLYSLYSPTESGNATSKIFNILNLIRQSDFLRVTKDTLLGGAAKQCPHHPEYDPRFTYTSLLVESEGSGIFREGEKRDKRVVKFNVASAVVSAFIVLIFWGTRLVAKNRYRVWRTSLTQEARGRLDKKEQTEARRKNALDQNSESLFRSRALPKHVRFLVPVALVSTVGVQLISHLAMLCYVDIDGQIAGETFTIHKFLVFRFIEASRRSYRNGGSEMAILLFVFTGIWPYVKLFTCLVLWFARPATISVAARGKILLWLDVFAKLSMVDIVTTLLAVAVLLIYVGGAAERELESGEFFATRIIIVPCVGFYCIVIAQRLTRISSTYLRVWHDQLIASTDTTIPKSKQPEISTRTLQTAAVSQEYSTSLRDFSERFTDDEIASNAENLTRKSSLFKWIRQEDGWVREAVGWDLVQKVEEIQSPKTVPTVDSETMSNVESVVSIMDSFKKWRWHRVAMGMTGLTVFILAVIGMAMAPSVSIDAKTLWGLFESGKTFAEAVSDYPLFRIICSILVQARLVLDSPTAKAGLGILLALAFIATSAFPILKSWEWHRRRKLDRQSRQEEEAGFGQEKSLSVRLRQLPSTIAFWLSNAWNQVKKAPQTIQNGLDWCQGQPYASLEDASDMDLLPAYQIKAWRHLDVYVCALVVAVWQLGAVAAYVIHQYCTILELAFQGLVFLGLVEETSCECFREQASHPSTVLVIIAAFLVLVISFFVEAIGHFRGVMAKAREEIQKEDVRRTMDL